MDGFLNLNKPYGFTSHDCVAKVRRLLKLKRVGHAGTLDPAATGVLPVAVGRATRLLPYLRQDKAYQATIRLGVQTTTDDLEGEVLQTHPVADLSLETVQAALQQFQGVIQQVPPNYSAIQVQGKRLYDLARQGLAIALPSRSVEVFQIEVRDWRTGEFPELDVAIACGPGTYIRAIARDLGIVLNTGGTLAALTRTASCGFTLATSLTLDDLATSMQPGKWQPIAPAIALAHLPKVVLPDVIAQRWCQGQRIGLQGTEWFIQRKEAIPEGAPVVETGMVVRVHRELEATGDRFLGVGEWVETDAGRILIARMVFAPD